MKKELSESYAQLYRQHWWWRAREDYLMDRLKSLPLPQQPAILDIGCGGGWFFDRLSTISNDFDGVEPDSSLLEANCPYRERIHHAPFDVSFHPAKKYDLIFMLDVLEHIEDASGALDRAISLLKENGFLVLTVPAFLWLWTYHDESNLHVTRYTRRRLEDLINRTELEVKDARYFFHWLVPLKLAIRFKEFVFRGEATPPSGPARYFNQFFYWLSRSEARCLNFCKLPWGSSLFLVARISSRQP